jgi:hypothetical protein
VNQKADSSRGICVKAICNTVLVKDALHTMAFSSASETLRPLFQALRASEFLLSEMEPWKTGGRIKGCLEKSPRAFIPCLS